MPLDMDELIFTLSDYDAGKLTDSEKMFLKDHLIDLNEQLHKETITEGDGYEEITYIIHPGQPLPNLYDSMKLQSALSNEKYEVMVKEITSLKWNNNNDLIVSFLGKKVSI